MAAEILTFDAVDELGFADSKGLLAAGGFSERYSPRRLGPLMELLHLSDGNQLLGSIVDDMVLTDDVAAMLRAFRRGQYCWYSEENSGIGFMRFNASVPTSSPQHTEFLMRAKRAAKDISGFQGTKPGLFVAALIELASNIFEHSEAVDTGVIAYRAVNENFEFVVSDMGIGVLASLRKCPTNLGLKDHGVALREALRDGVSRHGYQCGRGYGFQQIFKSLVDLNGELRFRSGDAALTMCGTSLGVANACLSQKVHLRGFFLSLIGR